MVCGGLCRFWSVQKSTLGCGLCWPNELYLVKMLKQKIIVSSTKHVRSIAFHKATSPIIWLENFSMELNMMNSISRPIKVYCYNNANIFYFENNKDNPVQKL